MALSLKSVDLSREKMAYLVIPVCEKADDAALAPPLAALVEKARTLNEFKGKKGDCVTFYEPEGLHAARVACSGLGEPDKLDRECLRTMAAGAVKSAMGKKLTTLHIVLPKIKTSPLKPDEILEAIAEGACLANHVFDKYKKEKNQTPLMQIILLATRGEVKKYQTLIDRIAVICEGTRMAREWVSTPSNEKAPGALAAEIASHAKKVGLSIEILTEKELKQKKFGALLAVSNGSDQKPCLVTLMHAPRGAKKTILLVGKGITFDSGGLNLKQGPNMDMMKMDMAGAAAVAATLITAARLRTKINLIGVMPLVENMPSGKACRPGDIIKSLDGKTIEIGNTDAEGRLILADALTWAIARFKPDITLDLATLTGACVAALGERIAGIFTTDDELADLLSTAGQKTHERCWPMPMPDDYREFMKSEVADIRNMSSTSYGGAITAALFLSEFTNNTRWAHIDIAGTAFLKNGGDYCPPGGSGYGVRLLTEAITAWTN
ncbi:MAG: leucyl aminopeptidase [Desulfobacterales bacterium]|jgi:leucyl aminopeptidase|nr:leucyl aminopeptidase [Desulfobacterales bacterium]